MLDAGEESDGSTLDQLIKELELSKMPLLKSRTEQDVERLEPRPHLKRHRSQESAEPCQAPSELATPRSTPCLLGPKQGPPETLGLMQRIQPGEYRLALKGVYGMDDAPNSCSGRHARGLMDTGVVHSLLAPRTLFLWIDEKHPANEHVNLTGIAGTHVDNVPDVFT